MRILCVDDDAAIRMTIQAYLDDLGHDVSLAPDGEQCLQLPDLNAFDAVLLDLNMPGMGGLATLERLRDLAPELPVVVVSGTGNIQDVISALRLGAADFITKPVEDMAILLHSVNTVAERSRLIKENREHRERLEIMVEERTRSLTQEVAERAAAEEALRAALAEKTVLLKEVHHRVKNNLQIVCSLLSLQALRYSDDRLAAPFQDSQARVRAMALVHEKLYRSQDLSRIDLAAYMSELTLFLVQAYCSRNLMVTPDLDCQSFHLAVDSAVPCGLIINELVTNSLKHAFNGRSTGVIRLRAALVDGHALIAVSDDGNGLPSWLDLDNPPSLGLQLVTSLVRQLRGTLRVHTGPGGAAFEVSFPVQGGEDAALQGEAPF
ncbi:Blue-light-activated histidine kinase 2 [Fundidesulfovibrio magnetotacticus]|uniref:Blue-light-activated histidine kinase 2 n=1 Tax=Fundidesulfovibrio magnetotacticus TaxID=2730080 RepID=A0A6V8LRA7_9BACT|nr:response regulator [Fundidesulfovibrio magnetotacticus]GFK95023.1 Blue-light-activated histidine kinase 2 [Fundidesulfovibrio magnetotacticus]